VYNEWTDNDFAGRQEAFNRRPVISMPFCGLRRQSILSVSKRMLMLAKG
jgi:hypothetical protein